MSAMASQITSVLIVYRLYRRISKKTLKLRVIGLCEGNSTVTGKFPAQRDSNAENAFIWWRHHGLALRQPTVWRPSMSFTTFPLDDKNVRLSFQICAIVIVYLDKLTYQCLILITPIFNHSKIFSLPCLWRQNISIYMNKIPNFDITHWIYYNLQNICQHIWPE